MKFALGLMSLFTLLAACERYTEKNSPCFGNTGKPIVARAVQTPLTLNLSTEQAKDCVFEDLSKPLG